MHILDPQKYPDHEVRTPRELFTAKLRKICARLDAQASCKVSGKTWSGASPAEIDVSARSLWVFGSYSRGAPDCGDLDLLLELNVSVGRLNPAATKALIGAHAQVRTYVGTPESNQSGVGLAEAILLWKPGFDWTQALDAIHTDPLATRFPRETDVLPLRVEQDGLDCTYREVLAQLHKDQYLSWRFVPLSAIPQELEPADDAYGGRQEKRVLRLFGQRSAMKQKLLPVVRGYARLLASERCPGALIEDEDYSSELWVGGTHLQVGTLNLDADRLESLFTAAIAFIPALSTRGPNGAWLIERGPQHPVTQAFQDTKVWALVTRRGQVNLVQYYRDCPSGYTLTGRFLDAYSSEQKAREAAEGFNKVTGLTETEEAWALPQLIGGRQLLQTLAKVDGVIVDNEEDLALTARGCWFMAPPGGLAAILSPCALAEKLEALQSLPCPSH